MQPGHASLPNGLGLDLTDGIRTGVAANELTDATDAACCSGSPTCATSVAADVTVTHVVSTAALPENVAARAHDVVESRTYSA